MSPLEASNHVRRAALIARLDARIAELDRFDEELAQLQRQSLERRQEPTRDWTDENAMCPGVGTTLVPGGHEVQLGAGDAVYCYIHDSYECLDREGWIHVGNRTWKYAGSSWDGPPFVTEKSVM